MAQGVKGYQAKRRKIRLHWVNPVFRSLIKKTRAGDKDLSVAEAKILHTSPNATRKFLGYFDMPDLVAYMDKVENAASRPRMSEALPTADWKPKPTTRVTPTWLYPGSFYATETWKRLRYDAIKKSDGRCSACGNSRATGAVLNVDHIQPISKAPHLMDDPNNLQVLCSDCNWGKGNRDTTDWRTTA